MSPPDAAHSPPEDVFVPAGFLPRSAACVVDLALVLSGQALLGAVLAAVGLPDGLSGFLQALLAAGYFSYPVAARSGQTPGKRFAGIAVVRGDGGPVGPGRALGRYAAWLLSFGTLGLGFLAALLGAQKKALHDYLAGTRVIRSSELDERRRKAVLAVGVLPLPLALAFAFIASSAPSDAPSSAPAPAPEAAREDPALEDLRALRSAVLAYAGGADGSYPSALDAALTNGGLDAVPMLTVSEHDPSDAVEEYGASVCAGDGGLDRSQLRDSGRWAYVADSAAACRGRVFIDCTHPSPDGQPWFAR
ncbi:MAG TPA: RDD family protein [Elusimicrobiota bacterium]|nr:RDD family protein [Elusimicrobiota bacterium]